MELNLAQTIAIYALPVIFAITLHEGAHGYVAKHFGDLTAYAEGRVSLNPLRHIDPIGTVALPVKLKVVADAAPAQADSTAPTSNALEIFMEHLCLSFLWLL